MRIQFYKMHASGNDFIIIDNREGKVSGDVPEMARRLCRPHFSVGADGLILIEKSTVADFKWRFFNSDGSEGEMCGNGSRCAAMFAYARCIGGRELCFETQAGIIRAEIKDGSVKVQLTQPTDYCPEMAVDIGGKEYKAAFINTGVPHVVYFVEDIESVDVSGIGAATRYHEIFKPAGTNANFAQVSGDGDILLRTYERGVEAETMACGTGATAAALVAGAAGLVKSPVRVKTRGGAELIVHFDWDGNRFGDVFLEGDAVFVYQGVMEEGALL